MKSYDILNYQQDKANTINKAPEEVLSISKTIRDRLSKNGIRYFANDNISEYISENELILLQNEIKMKIQDLLETMIIDTENDHNTVKTADRMAKMYINEVFRGRYHKLPSITEFPNHKNLKELYVVGPINFVSTCSHHFLPIIGRIWVGVLANERIIGLSKFNRIVDWVMNRPHIQEEAVVILADKLVELIEPEGLAIAIKARHFCMAGRGVKDDNTIMTNTVVRGKMIGDSKLKEEFFNLIRGMHFDDQL